MPDHAHMDATVGAIDPCLASDDGSVLSGTHALATRLRTEKELDPQLEENAAAAAAAAASHTSTARAALNLQLSDMSTVRSDDSPSLTRQISATLDTLRPMDIASPSLEGSVASPTRERLPSISQLTQQLGTHSLPALAEAATQQEARQQHTFSQHQHNLSYGSNGAQSPLLTHHQQSSPVAFPAFPTSMTARSPTTAGDTPYYQSPQAYAPYSFYAHRRPSNSAESVLPMPPSLPSASSSGESQGPAGSSMDGYSTSHTTPIDAVQSTDTTPRPLPSSMLPPPPGGFKCPFDGCLAPPFQTQYLLTSHKNVHSQDRPHYCPVKDCPRGEGGKGFKRKNEMIRHGLVHKSPGYICPFCPEREHKYPRPDNLQRHVRVHHVDKDRDDPALQEVLNQRTEGQGKTRRRRTTMSTTSASAAAAA